MNTRPAAVAGMFYEADNVRLQAQVNALYDAAVTPADNDIKALIVPHAGYIYSGATAAQAYKALESRAGTIRRVVLFGPAHRVYLNGLAIPSVDYFSTPLGDVALDRSSLDRIKDLPGVVVSDEAHRQEHSLEVQLPFIQNLLDNFCLVPVVVGDCPPSIVAKALDALWGNDETVVIISSDLSHFHSYQQALHIDNQTCERIVQKVTNLTGEEACGARAINGLMDSEHGRNLSIELLSVCNSGDTAGDRNRVVGYGAFALK